MTAGVDGGRGGTVVPRLEAGVGLLYSCSSTGVAGAVEAAVLGAGRALRVVVVGMY